MKYIALFILLQLINIPLIVLGWFTVALCVTATRSGWLRDWPHWAWLWFNDQDGYGPSPGWWGAYSWLAWRNPVNNFRFVPGVSAVGRPLWRKTWGKPNAFGKPDHYVMAGWNSSGFPVLSGGTNPNPF